MIQKERGIFVKYLFRNALDGYSIFIIKAEFKEIKFKGIIPDIPKGTPLEIKYKIQSNENLVVNVIPTQELNEKVIIKFLRELGFSEKAAIKLAMSKNLFKTGSALKIEKNSEMEDLAIQKMMKIQNIGYCMMLKKKFPEAQMLYIQEYINGHPGTWECLLTDDLNFVKTVYFHLKDLDTTQKEDINSLETEIQEKLNNLIKKQISSYPVEKIKIDLENQLHIKIKKQEIRRLLINKGYIVNSYDELLLNLSNFNAEQKIVTGLRKHSKVEELFDEDEILDKIESIELSTGMKYHEAQKNAFQLLKTTGVKVLTGGPGTGKTTVLKGIMKLYIEKYGDNNIQLCAPTGRAAQRMTEATGRESCTIHHLMCTQENILAKFVVVDESSMVDNELMSWLLQATSEDALILLVGDIDQLPSVGTGQVLFDLIKANAETRRLARTFRNDGSIVENVYKVKAGNPNLIQDDKFKIIRPDNLLEATVEAFMEKLQNSNVFDVQILCPTYKGEAGIDAINKAIQNAINPKRGQKCTKYGNTEFREGDKIICLHNNYENGYFNGDIGIIKQINDRIILLDIQGKEIELDIVNLSEITLGYAITVHKSQGSEFKHVIITLQSNVAKNLLQQRILFTAISRSKATCLIISDVMALEQCCKSREGFNEEARLHGLLTA